MMKRIELSDVTSNVLLMSSIMLALTPMLLGDQLILIVGNALRECGVWFDQASTYLTQIFG